MSAKKFQIRSVSVLLAAAAALNAGAASAIEFQIGDEALKVDNLFTLGAMWRMQDPDPSLIGKSTLFALHNGGTRDGLCMERTSGSPDANPNTFTTLAAPGANTYTAGDVGAVCATSGDNDGSGGPEPAGSANTHYVQDYRGSYSPNGDNGDLNFEKGDVVHAVAKLTTDLSYSVADYNFFVRTIAHFDANYADFTETHYDTTMQASSSDLGSAQREIVGMDLDVLDYTVGHIFSVLDRDISVKVGNQVLNWGESSLLALNSLNTINPPDARRLNTPGLDLKEAFRPIGMAVVGMDVMESVSAEVFYAYDWKPILIDPPGTYFSQSDTLGPGGDYAMLSFAKAPEDPGFTIANPTPEEMVSYPTGRRGYYRPIDTCTGAGQCADSIGLLGSTASRTIFRDHEEERKREPEGGDYGISIKHFLESVNNGTEVAFYYAKYDSRIPVASAFASQRTCITDAAGTYGPGGSCGTAPTLGTAAAALEPIPVDTARLLIEYPKDIKLFGMSFNTTVGDYALSGEYAYRPNLPIQVDTVDLTYTALQPAFPEADVNLGAVTIPGRQSAFPSFLTAYRGYACDSDATCIQPGQYIAGYERFKVGQANLTVLRLIGGDNPIGASQMTILFETGMQQVFDMPSLNELQLEGTGSDTHISGGSDGTGGIDPAPVTGNLRANTLRQNPTANKDYGGYGTSESYGFRLLNLNRWDSALFGANLETLAIVRMDVKGTSPGIGTNFSDGRKQYNFGLRADYLSTYFGEVRYTWFTGGGHHDGQRDRDNIQVYFGYQF
jgi:hypothetical protein